MFMGIVSFINLPILNLNLKIKHTCRFAVFFNQKKTPNKTQAAL